MKKDKFTGEQIDIVDCLSDSQLKELKELAAEPDDKDTVTLVEFYKLINVWREPQ
jgi:hypothetical protein